ncbi:MAG: potassium channel family protein [Candidatus Poribacteria bacterium]
MIFYIIFKKYFRFIKKENIGRLLLISLFMLFAGSILLYLLEKGKNENINSYGDALWWGIVTLATVGYGDIFPITIAGRIVGAFVILFGIGFIGLFTASIASVFVERKLRQDRGLKALKNLKGHILICGWNYNAKEIISEIHLDNREREIVIIANLEEKPIDEDHIHFVRGNPADISKLEMACFRTAEVAIVLHDDSIPGNGGDGQSILTVLTIKKEHPNIYVCIQILDENNAEHCKRAGADEIIVTGGMTSKLLAQSALDHGVTKVVSELMSQKYGNEIYKIPCPQRYIGHNFKSALAEFKDEYDGIIIGIEKPNQLLTNPKSDILLDKGDYIIVISEQRPHID